MKHSSSCLIYYLKIFGQSGTRNAGADLEFGKLKSIFEVKEVDFGFRNQKGISE